MSDLARLLVQHQKWEWKPGMGIHYEWGIGGTAVVAGAAYKYDPIPFGDGPVAPLIQVPLSPCVGTGGPYHEAPEKRVRLDIHHPATKGWLLAMLREAHPEALCFLTPYEAHDQPGVPIWDVRTECVGINARHSSRTLASAPTEGEALAAALLAAWGTL